MTFSGGAPEKLRIGRVFSMTFDIARRNFGLFLGLSFVGALPSFLSTALQLIMAGGGVPQPNLVFAVPLGLIGLVTGLTLQGALVRLSYADISGAPRSPREALMRGFRAVLPLLGLNVLVWLGVWVGLVLLFIPGLMLLVRWIVALPAYMIEDRGVMAAMGRSAELTKGSRWRIFGLLIILLVIVYAIEVGAIGLMGGFGAMARASANPATYIGFSLVVGLVGLVAGMLAYSGVTVLYSELRRRKEGSGADVAAVFE